MWIHEAELAQLCSRGRMADKYSLAQLEVVEDRDIVARPRANVVASGGLVRSTVASARDANDPKIVSELVGKIIPHVGVVAEPGEQHHGLTRAAKVQHLELHAGLDGHERHFVGRGIETGGRLRRARFCRLASAFVAVRWIRYWLYPGTRAKDEQQPHSKSCFA